MVNYSTLLCFDSILSYNTNVQNNIIMTTAKQNQKFPFHFFFRFAVEGWGEETRGKCKEIFWVFAHASPRACPRRIGSHHHAIGAYEAVSSHHALRACDQHSSSGLWSKYIRTLSNTHRKNKAPLWGFYFCGTLSKPTAWLACEMRSRNDVFLFDTKCKREKP
jgi:hypothetical protein